MAKRAWETGKMATEEFREALREPHLHLQVGIVNTIIITIIIVDTSQLPLPLSLKIITH